MLSYINQRLGFGPQHGWLATLALPRTEEVASPLVSPSPSPDDIVNLDTSPLRSHLGLSAPLSDEEHAQFVSIIDRFGLRRDDGQPIDGTRGIQASRGIVDGPWCDSLSGRLGAGLDTALPAAHECADAMKRDASALKRLYLRGSPATGRDGAELDKKLRLFLEDRIDRIEASMRGEGRGGYSEARVPPALKEAARDLRFILFDLNCKQDSLKLVNRLSAQDPCGLDQHPGLSSDIKQLADELAALCSAQGAGHPRGLRTQLAQTVPDCNQHVVTMQQSVAHLADGCRDLQLKAALRRLGEGLQGLAEPQPHSFDNPTVQEIRRRLQQREWTPVVNVEDAARQYAARDSGYVQSLASVAEIAARSNPSATGSQGLSPTAVNTAIERQMVGLQRQLGRGDPRLLRFLHVASIFLDPRDRSSFEQTRYALCALVYGKEHPSAAAIEAAWPTRLRRLQTLVDELPTILAALDEGTRAGFVRRLDGTDAQDRNVQPTAWSTCAGLRQLGGRDNPNWGGPIQDWASGSGASLKAILELHVIQGTPGERRAVLAQLERLCCNLEGIRGRRKELAEAVGHLADRDSGLRAMGRPPILSSQELYRLVKPLVIQLAHPDFKNRETQNAILRHVDAMLGEDGRTLGLSDRASLLVHLATVAPKLGTARVLNHLNPQGVVARLIADQLKNLPSSLGVPVLNAVLDHLGEASLQRTAPSDFPRTYGELARNTAAVGILTASTLGMGAAFGILPLIKGSRSPQQRLADSMGRYLLAQLGRQRASPGDRESLLPVVQRILSTRVSPDDAIERRLQARAVMSLCLGGIPLDADAATRDRCVDMAVGHDAAVRVGLMQALAQLCVSKRPGKIDRSGVPAHVRLGAGRLLLNLLAANGGEMTRTLAPDRLANMRAAAHAAIIKATKGGYFPGDGRPGIALAMLREAGSVWPDMPEDLKGRLTECVIGGLHRLPSGEAARLMPLVVEGFDENSKSYGKRLQDAMKARLKTGTREERRDTMLALIEALGHFQGSNPESLVDIVRSKEVLGSLTPELQASAIDGLATDFGSITPAGRRAILAFVGKLKEERRADGGRMLLNVLANDGALNALDDDERQELEASLARSLEALQKRRQNGGLDSLMHAAAGHVGTLPDSVLHMLIPYARDIDPVTLRMLMSAWVNDLPYKTAEEARGEFGMWAAEARKASEAHRIVMDTMLFLAQQARSDLPQRQSHLPNEAVMRAAIPGLAGTHVLLAVKHAGTIDKDLVAGIVAKLGDIGSPVHQDTPGDPIEQEAKAERRAILRQCYSADQAGTLEVLGRRFGTTELFPGGTGSIRHGLDQWLPVSDGEWRSLDMLLEALPAATVAPALAAMAGNVGGAVVMPQDYRDQFAALLRGFAARAEPQQTMQVLDALVNPALLRANKGAKIDFKEPDMALVRALATDLVPNNVSSRKMTRFLTLVSEAGTGNPSAGRRTRHPPATT